MLLVRGKIVFDVTRTPTARATAYVRLEDVSAADAPAVVHSQAVVREVALEGDPPEVSFSLHGEALDPRRRYNVRALVDLDGDGQVGIGDYTSTQTHPVGAEEVPCSVTVPVRRVS